MSDLYLIQRRRLDQVTDWVPIETAVLKQARIARGLSYEAVARQLHVVSKTYERYEKGGRVPRQLLPRLAEILGLEIESSPPARISDGGASTDAMAAILERLDRIEALLRNRPAS